MPTPQQIKDYIAANSPGVNHVEKDGDSFFIYDPGRNLPPNKQIPFATLITRDDYDTASQLSRDGVFRLNVGVSVDTYRKHFGEPPAFPKGGGIVDTGHDFSVLDTLLPHPIYAAMGWVCVLNPSDSTWTALKPMLSEAYEQAKARV